MTARRGLGLISSGRRATLPDTPRVLVELPVFHDDDEARLRGTSLDPFGYGAERRMERS